MSNVQTGEQTQAEVFGAAIQNQLSQLGRGGVDAFNVRFMARSLHSPIVTALCEHAERMAVSGVQLSGVIGEIQGNQATKTRLDHLSNAFQGGDVFNNFRLRAFGQMKKLQEQATFGATAYWVGETIGDRRAVETGTGTLFNILTEADRERVSLVRLSFGICHASAKPLETVSFLKSMAQRPASQPAQQSRAFAGALGTQG